MEPNTSKISNSITFNVCSEDTTLLPEEFLKRALKQAERFENLTSTQLIIGKEKIFSKIIQKFYEVFKPEKTIETFDFDSTAKKFLIAENEDSHVILFVGNTPTSPFLFAIFVRKKREKVPLFEESITTDYVFGRKLSYDYVCYYHPNEKKMACNVVSLLSSSTESTLEPILSLIVKLI